MTALDTIVIGASLGGLDALSKLFAGLPGDLNASVLVALHTSPYSPGFIADILGGCTSLKVAYGQHARPVEAGHIYIAPADHHMTVVRPGFIRLNKGPKVHFSRPSADPLFSSAAEVYGSRVIGVVLTGLDGDGTEGLRAIKLAGGVSVVQDPNDAIASSMPRRALRGHPDFKVSLDEMAALLVRLVAEGNSGASAPRRRDA